MENENPSKEEINKMVEEIKAKMVFQPAVDLYNKSNTFNPIPFPKTCYLILV